MLDFSAVIPVHDEVTLIPRSLPSYYDVEPSDMVLCFDDPPHPQAYDMARNISQCYPQVPTRFVFVERSDEWCFHQAHVRREGLHHTAYPRILTGDIDLVINRNVWKAIEMIGHNNIGLVSLSKFRHPHSIIGFWRSLVLTFLRKFAHRLTDTLMATTTFSGLYALWKPYWLETEKREDVQHLINPKQFYRGENPTMNDASTVSAEDTFLRDRMLTKHRCMYLRDIGAIDLGVALDYQPYVQFMIGQYFARQGRSFLISLGRAILRGQPQYLQGYLIEKNRLHT